jgi:hypothetical protein
MEKKLTLKDKIRLVYHLINQSTVDSGFVYVPISQLDDRLDRLIMKLMAGSTNPLYVLVSYKTSKPTPHNLFYETEYYQCHLNTHFVYGPILFLVTRDICIVDIDIDCNLEYLKKMIERAGLDKELFSVHRTTKGFHLYLISRFLNNHSTQNIYARLLLDSDICHLIHNCQRGDAIRLTKKYHREPSVSRRVGQIGTGLPDPNVEKVYREICAISEKFSGYTPETVTGQECMGKMYELWRESLSRLSPFGRRYRTLSVPNLLAEEDGKIVYRENPLPRSERPTKCHYIPRCGQHDLRLKRIGQRFIRKSQHFILDSGPDHLVVYKAGDNIYTIVYRDLLVIDYDRRDLIRLAHEYVRYHPECTFRAVRTFQGHHLFLTSRAVEHGTTESFWIQNRLRSDRLYNAISQTSGYFVRLNPKCDRDIEQDTYREERIIGSAPESDRLLELYRLHFQLSERFRHCVPVKNFQSSSIRTVFQLLDRLSTEGSAVNGAQEKIAKPDDNKLLGN